MTTIESNVAVPAEKPKRTRKKNNVAKENPAAALIKALDYVGLAQRKEGTPYQTHCRLEHHWAMTFDGVLSLGSPILEDLTASPNTAQLQHALAKCGDTLSIAQLTETELRVVSGKFKAKIECLPMDQVAQSFPDQRIANCNDEVRAAFEALAWLTTEGASNPAYAGTLLQANTAVATNGHAICEYWHGNDLPPGMLIPKHSVAALLKVNKKINGFGYTPGNSATFWFEDGSYFKTQLFNDQFPSYTQIFDIATNTPVTPMPADFFKALDSVLPLSKSKFVYFHPDLICSHYDIEAGASYELAGLPGGMKFNGEYLKAIASWFDNVKFPSPQQVCFSKGSLRGSAMGGNAQA